MFNRFDLDVFHPLTHKIIVIVFVIKIKYDDSIQLIYWYKISYRLPVEISGSI